jgi:hypothetical protein
MAVSDGCLQQVLFLIHPWKEKQVRGLRFLQTLGMNAEQTIFDSLWTQQYFVQSQDIQGIR